MKGVLYLLTLTLMTGCFHVRDQKKLRSSDDNNSHSSKALSDCQFVSVPTLRNFLTTLGLSRGDTQSLQINTHSLALGAQSDQSPSDLSCSTVKYKLATEIMINACEEAGAANMQRLFPNGTRDFKNIYLVFLGRSPTEQEIVILDNLVSRVSDDVSRKAVCAAVLSSVEVLARNT